MPRARPIALLVVLALVAGLGVTGCAAGRPDTAAIVGGVRITAQQVEEVAREAVELRADPTLATLADAEEFVLGVMVMTELGRRIVAERSLSVAPPDVPQVARQLGVGPDSKLARLFAEWLPVGGALAADAAPAQPSDEDIHVIIAWARRHGQVAEDARTEDLAKRVRADADLPYQAGLRDMLRAAGDKYGLVVNPRYGPLKVLKWRLPLLSRPGVVDVPVT